MTRKERETFSYQPAKNPPSQTPCQPGLNARDCAKVETRSPLSFFLLACSFRCILAVLNISANRPKLNQVIQGVARQGQKKTYRPRVSNAGSCPRALTYQALGVEGKGEVGRMPVLLSDGNLHEDSTITWLEQGGVNVIMRQYGLDVAVIPDEVQPDWFCDLCQKEIKGNTLHGHIDGVIDDGDRYYLFEHKGLGDYGFENLDREFPKGYITQCCSYIKGLQNAGFDVTGALLLVKNKNNSEYRQIYIEYDAISDIARVENEWSGLVDIFSEVLTGLVELHSTVARARTPGANLPDRPYDQESFYCTYCAFADTCWAGIRSEVSVRSTQVTLPRTSDLGCAIQQLADAREEKRQVAEKEKEAKRQINILMAQQNIKSGETQDYKFWLSPFDKKYLDESAIPVDVLESARKSMTFMSIKLKKL